MIIMLVVMALGALAATIAVALGAHVNGWEELGWAWTAVVWCGMAVLESRS